MTLLLRRGFLIVLLVIVAIIAGGAMWLLPPRATASPQPSWQPRSPVIRGAYHIHSERSDGTGTPDDIAAAAARAGLQFVILTDHGDGTRAPDPPAYRSGVLCIDAVEVSTTYGHYAALGLSQTPYRLAGDPRDVIEDVHRFGGFGLAAHPGSKKTALQWSDWDAPFDGIEWLNADSEWRDEFWTSLGRTLLTYPLRSAETLATLLDRPDRELAQWDRVSQTRHVVGLAATDAHARLGFRSGSEPYRDRVIARLPSYEASFRAFANHILLDRPLSGDAAVDAVQLLSAIRRGRAFSSIEGIARIGGLEVAATGGGRPAGLGDYIESTSGVTLDARVAAPAGTELVVLRDGQVVHHEASETLHLELGSEPAAYRIEGHLPAARGRPSVPWLVTNPIYVNLRSRHAVVTPEPRPVSVTTAIAREVWHTESSAGSESTLSTGSGDSLSLVWRVHLADGPAVSQFAAIAFPANRQLASHERVRFRVRAERQMRIWVQLRMPGQQEDQRWAKAFFVGPSPAETIDLPFAEFRPLGPVSSEHPPLGDIEALLLVVDTLNTLPGTRTTFTIEDFALVK